MPISIAQSRQQLSSLIEAAQATPQVITKHNTPVAVLVSADYFSRSEAAIKPVVDSFYSQLLQLRETYAPQDNKGLFVTKSGRGNAWSRANGFAESE
jgi:prevent-host-death family protein